MNRILIVGLLLLNIITNAQTAYNQIIAGGLVRLEKTFFQYGSVDQITPILEQVKLLNSSPDSVEIQVANCPKHIVIEFLPKVIPPHKEGVMKVMYIGAKRMDTNGKQIWGEDYVRVNLKVSGKEGKADARTDFLTFRVFLEENFSELTEKQLKDAPIAKFDTIEYNFGKVPQGTIINHDFIVQNIGKNDLEIRYARGC